MMRQVASVHGAQVFFHQEGTWVQFVDSATARKVLNTLGLVSLAQVYPELESSEKENIFLGE